MEFKKIQLNGFKSFAEKTDFLIEEGLTGIVGPNGCGKSNVVEALRWCMGETSPKSMRGSGMEDIIFSGTQERPSRNNAEVTRFKGLGEISPSEFKAFINKNMKLEPIIINKDKDITDTVSYYMGKNTQSRQDFIIQNLKNEELIINNE